MSITADDIRLRQSLRMVDTDIGGGPMGTTVVVDGLKNNAFDDVTDFERIDGALSLRKVFGAALNTDTAAYLQAHCIVDQPAADTAVDGFIFASGGVATERAAALAAITPANPYGLEATFSGSMNAAGTSLAISGGGVAIVNVVSPTVLCIAWNDALHFRNATTSDGVNWALDAALPSPATGTTVVWSRLTMNTAAARSYGVATLTAAASASATTVTVDGVIRKLWPSASDSSTTAAALGRALLVAPTDKVLIHSTIGMTPATVNNGQTVTTGRTSLSRLRVIGNNGTVHGTFTLGQAAPTGLGFTANLTAGTVTFSDVAGLSLPVTVEHRIEELAGVTKVSVGSGVITLNRALSRAYPVGTRVSSVLALGTLQAAVSLTFDQATWAGTWSNTSSGGTSSSQYDTATYPIVVTNKGSVTERWALVFTNTTAFNIVGEALGVIGTGTTGADCSPINPATGVPYLTVLAAGWGGGWVNGNALRINTAGANAPVWAGRVVNPSAPTGDDKITLQLRGYTNT